MEPVTPTPTFSIVMTTFRRPQLLARAIQSVLDQTFPDFELIVVDDVSGDETPAMVARFMDPRQLRL